jgi:hypothetical protein
MPPFEDMDLTDVAILWPVAGRDANNEPLVGEPQQISCRWVQKNREVVTAQGESLGLDATAVVDREVAPESIMWLGALEDWYGGQGSAGDSTQLMQVKTTEFARDVKGRVTRRTVGLTRFRDRLPPRA